MPGWGMARVMTDKVRVGVIGCGNIFPAYVKGCSAFQTLDLVACADLLPGRARTAAEQWHIPKACTVEELLADKDVQIIINLTIPKEHAKVSLSVLDAGKHVYSEKPLGITFDEGRQVIESAKAKGLLVGCAPDTFLGGGLQTCRRLIDKGLIGRPLAASARMLSRGPENWHPNPEIFYQAGAGPMLDIGPYYVTAFIALLGAAKSVAGMAHPGFAERVITSKEHYGERLKVAVDTHVTGAITFVEGAIGTLTTSFDVLTDSHVQFEIYGEESTLRVPDPNTFGGPVSIWDQRSKAWESVPLSHSESVGRGIGVADMASALLHGRSQRASGALALHVLETMQAFTDSAHRRAYVELQTTVERPAALPTDLPDGVLD